MLSATDSFIEYLNTGLGGDPPVNWVRGTAMEESASVFASNALNLMVLGTRQDGSMEEITVSLDLMGTEIRQTNRWVGKIVALLLRAQLTPEFDYEPDPESPTPTGRFISWDGDDVDFALIAARPWRKNEPTGFEGTFVHYNATFPIRHTR